MRAGDRGGRESVRAMNQFMRNNRNVLAYTVFVIGMLVALYAIQDQSIREIDRARTAAQAKVEVALDKSNRALYEASIRSCERLNTIRSVVYLNTVEANRISPRADYAAQIDSIENIRYFDERTGTVSCYETVPYPGQER